MVLPAEKHKMAFRSCITLFAADWYPLSCHRSPLSPQELLRSCSMNTELKSELADCGGVGVFGEVGREGGVSGSVSAMLLKVIL